MAANLQGKVLTVLGGNGYVGATVCKHAVSLGAKVYGVCRSGNSKTHAAWASQVHWVKGDAMYPQPYQNILEESDAVVHSLGVLLDTSFTQFRRPGDEGTYEQVNRDTAKAIGQKLEELGGNKKIVYISASHSIPMINRYLQAKLEAEEFLFRLTKVRATALRPGFIYDGNVKGWTLPLKYGVNTYATFYKTFSSVIPNNTFMKDFVRNFEVDYAIDLESVAISAIVSAFDPKYDGKILLNQDMKTVKEDFYQFGLHIPKSEKKGETPEQEKKDQAKEKKVDEQLFVDPNTDTQARPDDIKRPSDRI